MCLSLRFLMVFETAYNFETHDRAVRSTGLTPRQVWRPERVKRIGSATKRRNISYVPESLWEAGVLVYISQEIGFGGEPGPKWDRACEGLPALKQWKT